MYSSVAMLEEQRGDNKETFPTKLLVTEKTEHEKICGQKFQAA